MCYDNVKKDFIFLLIIKSAERKHCPKQHDYNIFLN